LEKEACLELFLSRCLWAYIICYSKSNV